MGMQRKIFYSAAFCFFLAAVLLVVALARADQVTLAWDPNGNEPEGYRVYQRLEGEPYDYKNFTDVGKNTVFVATHLLPAKTYHFVVRAWSERSESADSNEVSYTTAPAACLGFLTPAGEPVADPVPGTYLLVGYDYVVEVHLPPEDNDMPPYSVNKSRTIYHRLGCRYYNPEAGIRTPEECPTCRACKICGKEE